MQTKKLIVVAALTAGMSFGLVACAQAGNTGTAAVEETEQTTEATATTEAQEAATSDEQADFYMTEITDDIFARIEGKSFKDDCTLPREDLRYLHVLHKDINGTVHEGEMIVNKHIAQDVLDILQELYNNDYPIERMRLVTSTTPTTRHRWRTTTRPALTSALSRTPRACLSMDWDLRWT